MSANLKLKNAGKIPIFIVPLVVVLDQVSKLLAFEFLPTVCNSGFAFGLLPGFWSGFVASLTVVVVGLVWTRLILVSGSYMRGSSSFGLSLILGGGISNLIDRFVRGCVVDFVDLKTWPAFNLADALICIGVVILIYSLLKGDRKGA